MSYSVSRRTREIDLRMALGAETRDVIKLIVKQGMGLTSIGALHSCHVILIFQNFFDLNYLRASKNHDR